MHGVVLPELEYESDEWFEARRRTLGASEIGAALGFSPWQSAYSLWAEKTGRLKPQKSNAAMRLGLMLEPVILDEFQRDTKMRAGFRRDSWRHPDVEWATASPDALALVPPVDDEDVGGSLLGIVEAKTDYATWDEIPRQYQLQVAWQFYVTGLDRAWIPLLATGHRKFEIYEIERDEHLVDVVVTAAIRFWDHVVTDTQPPVDSHEQTTAALKTMWQSKAGKTVELSAAAAAAMVELAAVKRTLAPLNDRKTHLENVIKAELEDAEEGTVGGKTAVTWRTSLRKGYTVAPGMTRRFLTKEI